MKKSNIVNIAVVLGLCLSPVALADDMNNLVRLDLKRSSDSAVDVTLVTSDNYGDNVMVRKKSDNKYVILVPKVKSSGYRASNLSGINDLVSNIDVKTVDDTSGGYTKVTLITTKPLDIKTRTAKNNLMASEQKEYDTLIAQANAVKNNISRQDAPQAVQKTEITVNKAPKAAQTTGNKSAAQKQDVKQGKNKIELTEITPEAIEKQARRTRLNNLIAEAKEEKALEELQNPLPQMPEILQSETKTNEIDELSANSSKLGSVVTVFKNRVKGISSKISNKIPQKLPKAIGAGLVAIIMLSLLKRLFKKSNVNYTSEHMNEISQDNIELNNKSENNQNYDELVNNKELSWREKYKLYLDKSATPVKRANKKGHYSFIKTPSKEAIEMKRQELEKLVESQQFSIEPEIVEDVYSEDAVISKNIKFKAFDTKTQSLRMTRRDKSRFKKYEVEVPLHEQKTVNLEGFMLSSNPRSLSDANLKVADVDSRRIKYEPKEYIMSSVDEYFSILDKEEAQTSAKLPEAESKSEYLTNPISKSKDEMAGSVVKSGFKIAQNKGIYLVNKNGKNTLIGKVNDKMFVLKKFDGKVTNPIQVRHDNENVYMVKAGGFKSLVEVNDEKMGVLIEL